MPDKNFAENMLESIGIGDNDHEKKKGRKGGRSSASKTKKKK